MPVRFRKLLIQVTATDVIRGRDIKLCLETVLWVKTRIQPDVHRLYSKITQQKRLVFGVFPAETHTVHDSTY